MSNVTSCQYESGTERRELVQVYVHLTGSHSLQRNKHNFKKMSYLYMSFRVGVCLAFRQREREIWVHTDIPRLVVFRSLEVSVLSVPLPSGDWSHTAASLRLLLRFREMPFIPILSTRFLWCHLVVWCGIYLSIYLNFFFIHKNSIRFTFNMHFVYMQITDIRNEPNRLRETVMRTKIFLNITDFYFVWDLYFEMSRGLSKRHMQSGWLAGDLHPFRSYVKVN